MRSVIVGLLLAGLLAGPVPAPAAGPVFAAAGAATADEKGKGKDDHKDEMNIFQGALDLTIWTIVVFVILFYILRTYAWGPIREGLDKREQSIAHDKLEAVRAKQEADALRAKLDQELARANDQVRQIMDKARQDAEALASAEVARGKAELQAEKGRLERDLKTREAQMAQELTARTAALATLISAKVVKKSLSEEEHRALLDEALNEFQGAARARVEDLGSARA